MNTEWWISVPERADPSALAEAVAIVRQAEADFSRFLPDSLLSRLNRERRLVDPALADLVSRALALGAATGGAFDIRVGPALFGAGYDRSFELLARRVPDPVRWIAPGVDLLRVEVSGDEVRLEGVGTVDLGGIAKGWTIDRVAEAIEAAGYQDYLIDGGGDIRAGGHNAEGDPWPVGVGDGLVAYLTDESVCTSSIMKRRWTGPFGDAHHVIDPCRGEPSASGVANVAVIAPDATTADVLATAVVADPSRGLPAVLAVASGALLERDGRWGMTAGMEHWIR